MELSLLRLKEFAASNPEKSFDINSASDWLAAQCATEFSSISQRMADYYHFEKEDNYFHFKSVEYIYGKFCEEVDKIAEEAYSAANDLSYGPVVVTGKTLENALSGLVYASKEEQPVLDEFVLDVARYVARNFLEKYPPQENNA